MHLDDRLIDLDGERSAAAPHEIQQAVLDHRAPHGQNRSGGAVGTTLLQAQALEALFASPGEDTRVELDLRAEAGLDGG